MSIVTAVLDRVDVIGRAVESAMAASASGQVDIVVVDGGSTDGTLEVLAGYPELVVRSEPDQGVYDAWNKGVALSKGEWLLFLNSDDTLVPGALDLLLAGAASEVDCVAGGSCLLDADGRLVRSFEHAEILSLRSPQQLTVGTVAINARLFRREFVNRVGAFDAGLRIAGDRDWILRAHAAGMRVASIGSVVYEYRRHPTSLTFADYDHVRVAVEHVAIAHRQLDARPADRRWLESWLGIELMWLLRGVRRGRWGEALPALLASLARHPVRCVRGFVRRDELAQPAG